MSSLITVQIGWTPDRKISVEGIASIDGDMVLRQVLMYAIRHLAKDRMDLGPCSEPTCETCKEDLDLATKITAMFDALDAGQAH